jgi:hypothetical protein
MGDDPELADPLGTRLKLVKYEGELPPDDEELEPDVEPEGSENLELIANFEAWNRGYQGGRDGEVYITLTVPLGDKYEAMKVTDEVGVVFQVIVYRKAYRSEWEAEG